MKTTLYVCETCNPAPPEDADQEPRWGESFACMLSEQLQQRAMHELELKRTRCLMACKRYCTVHLRAPGKIAYVLGDFRADATSVSALLDYCELYQQAATGQVPYREWPEFIKGKFIARVPPLES